jgi:DNA-directed RNA polymerase I, II, and III subunit RPABC3
VDLVIDVNAELFDVRAGERISLAIASTLSTDGTPDDGSYQVHMGPSLLDQYDYAMHGRVFSIKHIENQNVEVQASFGGLLCRLRGEQAQLEALQSDMMIYVLMRKGGSDNGPMDM